MAYGFRSNARSESPSLFHSRSFAAGTTDAGFSEYRQVQAGPPHDKRGLTPPTEFRGALWTEVPSPT